MALAFLFEDDSVMYIDAVTTYTKSKSSSVSKHPIDKSSKVADHISKDNPTFSLKGVISSADFNTYVIPLEDENGEEVRGERQPVNGAEISKPSSLIDYLPGSVQQFLSSTDPTEVTVDEFRGYSHQVARDRLNTAWDNSEMVTILDYDFDYSLGRSSSVRVVEDCVILNFTDNEDAQTGDSLDFTITFEKLRFAYLKDVDIQVSNISISDPASSERDYGDESEYGDTEGEERKNAWERAVEDDIDPAIDGIGNDFNKLISKLGF